jgi:hypothetical protein
MQVPRARHAVLPQRDTRELTVGQDELADRLRSWKLQFPACAGMTGLQHRVLKQNANEPRPLKAAGARHLSQGPERS